MTKKPISYVVVDDIPLEQFENLVLPPMSAKDVVLMLAGVSPLDYSRCELSAKASAEIRKLLIDELMPENPKADRAEIEAFVDSAIANVRAAYRT